MHYISSYVTNTLHIRNIFSIKLISNIVKNSRQLSSVTADSISGTFDTAETSTVGAIAKIIRRTNTINLNTSLLTSFITFSPRFTHYLISLQLCALLLLITIFE